jgi:hypothetical protein
MGEYLKTRYPGIFQYVGRNGTVYGIDYYAGGKKHREIIGCLLTEAREKLEERRNCLKIIMRRQLMQLLKINGKNMVGASRFERPTSCSQGRRANQSALRPDTAY